MKNQVCLTRVVKLTLATESIETFIQIWIEHKSKIENMEGCLNVQAFQDHKDPHIFFTISNWENEHALDNYRYSGFFKTLWSTVKPMFTAKAMAHSLTPIS